MNRTEAAKLLVHCAAFDNRQPSRAAAEAWAVALRDVPFDTDTLDAVARFYGTAPKDPGQRLWIQPHDVRTHRRAIRSERAQGFVYQPPAEEESAELYLARYRAQLEAVASGQVPAPSRAPMLAGGPHRAVAALLAGVGRAVPGGEDGGEQPKRARPLSVRCPDCGVAVGRKCRASGWGKAVKYRRPHRARMDAAREAAGLPPEPAEDSARAEAIRAASARWLAENGGGQ